MIAVGSPVTPEQLLSLPESKGLEIVNGRIVEKRMGYESSELAARLTVILGGYLLQHKLGRITATDAGFQCFPDDETKTRKPDLAIVLYSRLPKSQRVGSYCRVAPDLAIEVLSPHDEAEEIGDRVSDFLSAGTSLIWIVDEFMRQVIVYSASAQPRIFTLQEEITAEPVLPGFRCLVSEIFEGIPRAK